MLMGRYDTIESLLALLGRLRPSGPDYHWSLIGTSAPVPFGRTAASRRPPLDDGTADHVLVVKAAAARYVGLDIRGLAPPTRASQTYQTAAATYPAPLTGDRRTSPDSVRSHGDASRAPYAVARRVPSTGTPDPDGLLRSGPAGLIPETVVAPFTRTFTALHRTVYRHVPYLASCLAYGRERAASAGQPCGVAVGTLRAVSVVPVILQRVLAAGNRRR